MFRGEPVRITVKEYEYRNRHLGAAFNTACCPASGSIAYDSLVGHEREGWRGGGNQAGSDGNRQSTRLCPEAGRTSARTENSAGLHQHDRARRTGVFPGGIERAGLHGRAAWR